MINKWGQKYKEQITEQKKGADPSRKLLGRIIFTLFMFFFLFSIMLAFFLDLTTKNLKTDSDIGTSVLQDLLEPFPGIIDDLYLRDIDEPMERLFETAEFISFSFSSLQYPPETNLMLRLKNSLSAFAKSSDYIVSSFIYSSATDTYIADSLSASSESTELQNNFFSDIIYSYNSNTAEKNQIFSGKHLTFMFRHQNSIIVSKDLTTLSGQPHSTIFVILDFDRLASFIYNSYQFVNPYSVSIYDPNNNMLFTNINTNVEITQKQFLDLASSDTHIDKTRNSFLIYCSSGILRWQYILEVDQHYLSGTPDNNLWIIVFTFMTILLLTGLLTLLLYSISHKTAVQLLNALRLWKPETEIASHKIFSLFKDQIITMSAENQTLRRIVSSTSAEAVSSLFSLLITGQHVEEEDIQLILNNTGYGFASNDIYVSGVIHYSGADFLDVEERYRILNLVNATFDKFKTKNDCNICVFASDNSNFTVIVSFDSQTSIAKGKSKVNDLTRLLEESFEFSRLPLAITFGHMYNSILDLSFSYNEAIKTTRYISEFINTAEAQKSRQTASAEASMSNDFSEIPATNTTNDPSAENILITDEGAEIDLSDVIDRRAFQIAQLVSENRIDDVSQLIDRTISDIFKDGVYLNSCENSKRLISAVTDNIISYQFVNANQLSDVYSQFSQEIDSEIEPADMMHTVRRALDTLCSDFSEVLKKQRNPYIVSALEYIGTHYDNPDLSLEEIAETLKIAPNYLSTIFRRNLGKKLFEYVNEYRLEASISLLLNSEKTINEISVESGFGSARNYIRIFKKYKEITPGTYRKQYYTKTTHSKSEE